MDTLYSYIILGLLIGARLGYVFFTIVHITSKHPFEILHSGMEVCPFMAVLIGSIIAGIIVAENSRLTSGLDCRYCRGYRTYWTWAWQT